MRRCLCGPIAPGPENQRWLRRSAMVLRLAATLVSFGFSREQRRPLCERAPRAPEHLAPGVAGARAVGAPAELGAPEYALGVRHQRREAAVARRHGSEAAEAAVRVGRIRV